MAIGQLHSCRSIRCSSTLRRLFPGSCNIFQDKIRSIFVEKLLEASELLGFHDLGAGLNLSFVGAQGGKLERNSYYTGTAVALLKLLKLPANTRIQDRVRQRWEVCVASDVVGFRGREPSGAAWAWAKLSCQRATETWTPMSFIR